MSENKSTVLVIEDEEQMRKFVRLALTAQGYRVIEAANGEDGLKQAVSYTPDLVILDLGLPDLDGMEVARRLREWSAVPILIVSARGQESHKVEALDQGADDYLTKPFGAGELLARIRVALRHAARNAKDPAVTSATLGDARIDLARRLVFVGDQEIHLTPIEYKLVAMLVKHAGMVLTHKQLLDQVWGPGHAHQTQYLRVYMTQLRHKLEKNPARPKYLLTEPGVGYRLKLEI
jgi:two-component system, OmpR family, KDP operon response regulator KdpE